MLVTDRLKTVGRNEYESGKHNNVSWLKARKPVLMVCFLGTCREILSRESLGSVVYFVVKLALQGLA